MSNARVVLVAGVPEWSTSGPVLHPGPPPMVCHPTILCLCRGLGACNGRATGYPAAAACRDTVNQDALGGTDWQLVNRVTQGWWHKKTQLPWSGVLHE